MAIIVEDGSGIAGANSYVSVTEARAYAAARGTPLPVDNAAVEVLLIRAMDFVESYRGEFQGSKTDTGQPLQWPRIGVNLDGSELDGDVIPDVLTAAQIQLAIYAEGEDLMPTDTGRSVVMEKVDVVQVQYAITRSTNMQPIFTKAEVLLRPLLRRGLGGALRTLRV